MGYYEIFLFILLDFIFILKLNDCVLNNLQILFSFFHRLDLKLYFHIFVVLVLKFVDIQKINNFLILIDLLPLFLMIIRLLIGYNQTKVSNFIYLK